MAEFIFLKYVATLLHIFRMGKSKKIRSMKKNGYLVYYIHFHLHSIPYFYGYPDNIKSSSHDCRFQKNWVELTI